MSTYLLAIGINHYTDRAFRALSCCENDASEIHALFKRNLELGDRASKLVGAVSIADVKNELRRIGQEIRNGDTFVLFFAGHGYQHPKREDQFLLFPEAEARLVNKGYLDGMLSLSALCELTEHWAGVARVFILDACRSWLPGRDASGARFDNEAALAYIASRDPAFGPDNAKPTDSLNSPGGALPPVILNATRNGQEAKELEARQRGVLALALEQTLESRHKSGDVIWLGEQMLTDVNQRINELLQHGRLGVEQTPFLTPPSARVLLFKPTPVRETLPVESPTRGYSDTRHWRLACLKNTPEAYEAYVREAPEGSPNIEAAFARIEDLLSKSAVKVKETGLAKGNQSTELEPGTVFRDQLTTGGKGPAMVEIPGGRFLMGSPEDEKDRFTDEGPQHWVALPKFALSQTLVTQGEWKAVMGNNPSAHKGWFGMKDLDDHPVENVSWLDAQTYVEKLSALTGHRYRLPSEAEWEYACRAGTTTEFHTGRTITTEQANFDGNCTYNGSTEAIYWQKTTPARTFAPNDFGLYDMHGNLWEWVQDCWHDNYNGAPEDGKAWETDFAKNDGRVLRGGSWQCGPGGLRSAGRMKETPDLRGNGGGFRLARTLP